MFDQFSSLYPDFNTSRTDFGQNTGKFTTAKQHTPCPVCGSTKTDCRIKGDLVLCHTLRDDTLIPGFKFLKPSKDYNWGVWVRDNKGDYSWQPREPKQKKEKDKAYIGLADLDKNYRLKLAKQRPLQEIDKKDLLARGLSEKAIASHPFVSLEKGTDQVIGISDLFPGARIRGEMYHTASGYGIPCYSPDGKIIGYQIRNRKPEGGSKYLWAANQKNHILVNGNPELPLTNLGIKNNTQTVYLCEGINKALITHERLGISVIGASGGNFSSSPNQLRESLAIAKPETIRLALDAGDIINPHVLARWEKQYALLKKIAPTAAIEVVWYDQRTKADNDIDELTREEFEAIATFVPAHEFFGLYGTENDKEFNSGFGEPRYKKARYKFYRPIENINLGKLVITSDRKIAKEHARSGYFAIWLERLDFRLAKKEIITLSSQVSEVEVELSSFPWQSKELSNYIRYQARVIEGYCGLKPLLDKRDLELVGSDETLVKAINCKLPDGKTLSLRQVVAYGFKDSLSKQILLEPTEKGYFPELNPEALTGKIVFLQAQKGDGKTTAARKLIEKLDGDVIAITPSIKLQEQLANSIEDCKSLQEIKDEIQRMWASKNKSKDTIIPSVEVVLARTPRVALCINSVGKLHIKQIKPGTVVLIDEWETIARSLTSINTHINRYALPYIYRELKRIIRDVIAQGGIVLIADADLRESSCQMLLDICDLNDDFTLKLGINKPAPTGYDAFIYANYNQVKREIIEALAAGRKVIGTIDRADDVTLFADELRRYFPDKKIMGINARNAEQWENWEFLSDPNKFLEKNKIDCLIHSPVIATGYSIECPAFDMVFGIFSGVLQPNEARQTLYRYRLKVPRHIYIEEKGKVAVPIHSYTEKDIKDTLITLKKAEYLSLIEFESDSQRQEYAELLDFLLCHGSVEYLANNLLRENLQAFDYRDAIAAGLILDENCSVNFIQAPAGKKGSLIEKAKRDALYDERAIAIEQAKLISFKKYLKLANKFDKSEADYAELLKFEYSSQFGTHAKRDDDEQKQGTNPHAQQKIFEKSKTSNPGNCYNNLAQRLAHKPDFIALTAGIFATDDINGKVAIDAKFALEYIVKPSNRGRLNMLNRFYLSTLTPEQIKATAGDNHARSLRNGFKNLQSGNSDRLLYNEVDGRTAIAAQALKNIGLDALIPWLNTMTEIGGDGDYKPVTVDLNDKEPEIVKTFIEIRKKFSKNKGYYVRRLGMKMRDHLSLAEVITRLLRYAGLHVTHHKKQNKITVRKPYQFDLIISHYEQQTSNYTGLWQDLACRDVEDEQEAEANSSKDSSDLANLYKENNSTNSQSHTDYRGDDSYISGDDLAEKAREAIAKITS